jgi:hypothetical protein
MFFPTLCFEAAGFFCHKAPFVGQVKNTFEPHRITTKSIFAEATPGVNGFLNRGCLRPHNQSPNGRSQIPGRSAIP